MAWGSASASYGSLGVYSHVERTTDASPGLFYYFTTVSNAQFSDSLTIDASGLTGTQGSMVFNLHLEGNLTGSTNAYITARVTDVDNDIRLLNQQFTKLQDSTSLPVDNVLASSPLYFTYGVPFNYSMLLLSQASAAGGSPTSPGWATSDFSSTMTVTGIEVYDANLSPVATFTATYGSQTVPEPGTLLLLGLGLFGVAGIRRFRI